tara:strand:- start:11899 stop:13242 length:1344 start_codon:yes stop_codon:yes gene_type:complete
MKHRILIVEDDRALLEALVDTLTLAQIDCLQADSAESAILILKKKSVDLVVSDVQMEGMDGLGLLHYIQQNMPHIPVLLMTAYAEVDKAVSAIKQGAVDYLAKPFSPQVLLNQVSRYMISQPQEQDVIAADPKSIELFDLAKRVAQSDASVMICGPSGSGKEVLAHYIHRYSARHKAPFIAINCAAIPENMLEATLFGYEKGAYTGAHQGCPGKFEQAQGGTLLLDEISEMDLGLQAKLLRVLQEKEVERLGSRKTIELNVRVLATSNRDLKACVAEHQFREDLYYRLNVFPLNLPALSQRAKDILPLAHFFLKLYAQKPITLSTEAEKKLIHYHWTGNVRELENVMQRALILSHQSTLQAQDIVLEDASETEAQPQDEISTNSEAIKKEGTLNESMRTQEYQLILDALNQCDGRRKDVAEKLGISTRTLRYKLASMRELGIKVPQS